MFEKISNKTRAFLVGLLLLIAYGVLVSSITQVKIVVMFADVISGSAVIGIAVLMYPLFQQINKRFSTWYLFLKYAEGISMIIGGLLFLSTSFQYVRDVIYEGFHLYLFIISGFMFYYLLYRSELVPKFISVWGVLGISALLLSSLLQLVNIHFQVLDYLLVLIITNEVFLAIWLMIKGFDESIVNKHQL
jgi:hypothetical protein